MDENNLNNDILNEEDLQPEIEIITEEEQKKLCTFCGNELSEEDTFCISCGTKVAETTILNTAPVYKAYKKAKVPSTYTYKKQMYKKANRYSPVPLALAITAWALAAILTLNSLLTLANTSVSGMQFFSADYTDILVRIASILISGTASINFTILGCFMFYISRKK